MKPYTLLTAFRQEIKHWNLIPAQKALLMAFIYRLKLRMDGSSFDDMHK